MVGKHCNMMCNWRKHVCVGAGGFANQALTARLELLELTGNDFAGA